MQFSPIALFLSAAAASPLLRAARQLYVPCSGLYATPLCCATDVLGVADLDCTDPPTVPANATDFQGVCAALGQTAECCVLPLVTLPRSPSWPLPPLLSPQKLEGSCQREG